MTQQWLKLTSASCVVWRAAFRPDMTLAADALSKWRRLSRYLTLCSCEQTYVPLHDESTLFNTLFSHKPAHWPPSLTWWGVPAVTTRLIERVDCRLWSVITHIRYCGYLGNGGPFERVWSFCAQSDNWDPLSVCLSLSLSLFLCLSLSVCLSVSLSLSLSRWM